ncbi:MAG: DUF58 domain-containing protein [Planctomycetes bacterium]|nr:DUF58 domain-containing protein [Planctomycetota bacterium]
MIRSASELFDAAFVRQLEGLRVLAAAVPAGGRHAEQRSRARGAGLEFTDVRPYAPGDDFRAVDWHLYQRLDKLFLRLFLHEEDLPVYFLLDQSKSMARAAPSEAGPTKSDIARQAVAALGYLLLHQMDRVSVFPFAEEALRPRSGLSGKHAFQQLLAYLAALPIGRDTRLVDAVRELAGRRLRRGLCVVASDTFDPRGPEQVLEVLGRLPHRLLLLRPVHPGEARPAHLRGEIRAIDCESGAHLDLSVDDALLDRHESAYRAYGEALRELARRRGGDAVELASDQPRVPQLAQLFPSGVLRA